MIYILESFTDSRMSNKFSFREYLSEFATTTSAHIHIISNLLRQRTKEQKNRNVDVCKLFLSPQLSVCVCIFRCERLRQQP